MKTITLKEGERFGRLTVICEVEPKKYGKRCRVRQFLCKCDLVLCKQFDIIEL